MSKLKLHPLTKFINQKQKAKAKQLRNETLDWLAKTFPHAFDDSLSIHPLKIGILQDLLNHSEQAAVAGISKTKLREAVVMFTRKIDYLTCVKAREMRIDLNGNPTQQVTEEEAAQAAEKIKKLIEKNAKIARQNTTSANPPTSSTSRPQPIRYPQDHEEDYRQPAVPPSTHATSVIIKNKSRAFDPDAVARLKEKLGLTRTVEKQD